MQGKRTKPEVKAPKKFFERKIAEWLIRGCHLDNERVANIATSGTEKGQEGRRRIWGVKCRKAVISATAPSTVDPARSAKKVA